MADKHNPPWFTPVVGLSYVITFGFFAVLFLQIYLDKNPDMMIGALIGAFTSGVIGYHFGKNSSSATKDDTITELAKTAGVVAANTVADKSQNQNGS